MNSIFGTRSLNNILKKDGDRLGFVLAILIAGACLCFLLGHISYSLWFDECQTATIVRADSIPKLIDLAMKHRPYPPLYFLIARFSYNLINNEFGLRLPSAIFGSLTIVVLFLLGRKISGSVMGIVAALLLVFSPGMFYYFADANAYALLTFLATAATYFLHEAWQKNRGRDWLFYFWVSLLGLGSHQVYIFVLASQGLAGLLLFFPWHELRGGGPFAALALFWNKHKWFFLALAILLGCWAGWMFYYFTHGGTNAPLDPRRIWSAATGGAFDTTFYGLARGGRAHQIQVLPWLLILGAVGLFTKQKKHFVFFAVLYSFPLATITLFIEMSLPFNSARYVAAVYPLACLIAAHSLQFPMLLKRWQSLSILLLIVMSFLLGRYILGGYRTYWNAKPDFFEFQDWRGSAAYLTEKAGPNDLVLIHQWYVQEALDYYYKGTAQQIPVHEESLEQLISEVALRVKNGSGLIWVVDCTMDKPHPPLIAGLEKECGLHPLTKLHFKGLYVWNFSLKPRAQP